MRSESAASRVRIGKRRIQSVLDTHTVANQKTLEQKISDQGPGDRRVDPGLLGLAIKDLIEQRRLATHTHPATKKLRWLSNPATGTNRVKEKLDVIAPIYDNINKDGFGNLVGDALEIVIFKCLLAVERERPRYTFQGTFDLTGPKNGQGRYNKTDPPKSIGNKTTNKQADFLQFGYDDGHLCIECKNYREWIYPHHQAIKDTIIKAYELGSIPLLVARRIHYSTFTNLLKPSGIIGHQSLFQYYPADQSDLAVKVKDKNGLGFTDVTAIEQPHRISLEFFLNNLSEVVGIAGPIWKTNRQLLYDYANNEVDLKSLYIILKDQN